MGGNPQIVYPFLQWMLESYEKLKTRGYLARYLVPLSIPEEHFADSQIVTMFQQYTMRQSEFKEVHMQLESARATASNPSHLQAEVSQLENEKEQLHNKLEKLRQRITNDPEYANINFDEMLSITNKLRQEQEHEAKLYQDAAEQRHKLQRAEQQRIATSKKFQEMNHSDMGRMDPLKLVNKLRDEVQQRRDVLESRLEPAISEREKQLKHLAKIASNSSDYSADDVHDLARDKSDLSHDIDALLQRRENSAASNDSKISFIRDRLAGVEKRRDKLAETVAELEDEKREVENDLRKVVAEFKALTGAAGGDEAAGGVVRPKTDAQMKEYMNELNKKTQRYKTLKAELEFERQEVATLVRTEEILRSRAGNLEEFNREQERRLGVVGYGQTQEALESIAAQSHAINSSKGDTLEELSSIIERIKATLLKKKEKLAPQIKELRGVRADFEAVESVYKSKKNQYENVVLAFESDKLKLEQDVSSLVQGVADDQSHFHFLHCFNTVTAARQAQVAKEHAVKELYERAIAEQEAVTKTLRNDKKHVTEKHDDHVAQRGMFQALRGILNKKLDIARNPNRAGSGFSPTSNSNAGQQPYSSQFGAPGGGLQRQLSGSGSKHGSGTSSYLDQLAEESDRLVLEQ